MKFSYNYILMFFLIALFCCQNGIKNFKYGEGVYNKNVLSLSEKTTCTEEAEIGGSSVLATYSLKSIL